MQRLVPAILATALALAALPAQAAVVHADFDNPFFADNVSMGGPNLLVGIQTTIPTTFVATRIEMFTGEGSGSNSVALWTHDPVLNQPQTQLGSGSWEMGNTNGWQGALLSPPIVLTAGDVVWLVWAPQNGSQASVQGGVAGAQPMRPSFDGGATWLGPFQTDEWKFRIWTGTAGHYEVFGAGCAGTAGTPRLSWFGLPMAGSSFDVRLDGAPASTFAILAVGDSNTMAGSVPLPLPLTALGAPACSLLTSFPVTLTVAVDAAGNASMTLPLPPNPSIAGLPFFDQWFVLDPPANAFGFTVSNGGAAIVGA